MGKGVDRSTSAVGARLLSSLIVLIPLLLWPGEVPAGILIAWEPKEFLEVKVYRLGRDPQSLQPVVILADLQEERAMAIWIGPSEADAINAEIQGTKHPRPLTHELLKRVIQKMNGKVQRAAITRQNEGIFYAILTIEKGGSSIEIDARPSDSIVLALKFKAPLYVSRAIFNQMAAALSREKKIEEEYGLTLQDLSPLLAQSFSYKSIRGALVANVQKGSQADKDGLHEGDILVECKGEEVADVASFRGLLPSNAPLPVKIFRKGALLPLTLHPK